MLKSRLDGTGLRFAYSDIFLLFESVCVQNLGYDHIGKESILPSAKAISRDHKIPDCGNGMVLGRILERYHKNKVECKKFVPIIFRADMIRYR